MINGNSYEALTNNGIHQLFGQNFQGQLFTLQILELYKDMNDNSIILISDGHSWIEGILVKSQTSGYRRIFWEMHAVITFAVEDIEMIPDSYSFKLKKIREINTRVHQGVGKPVRYSVFLKNGLINQTGSNKIQKNQLLTIRQIRTKPVGQISGSIRARVIKKPDKVNTVMNIVIQDDEHQSIQCCFFGDSVLKYKSMLNLGVFYRFQDPILQMNNRFGNLLQLKISNNSHIVKDKNQDVIRPGIINSNNPPYNSKKQVVVREQFNIKKCLQTNFADDNDCYIVGRILKELNMKKEAGKTYECIDRFGNHFQTVLWNDFQTFPLNLSETYKFQHMRAKLYKGRLSFQSHKNRTLVNISDIKIKSKSQLANPKIINPFQSNPTGHHKNKDRKTLGTNDIVYTIEQMRSSVINLTSGVKYMLSTGYLSIRFQGLTGSFDYLQQLKQKLFNFKCDKCFQNQFMRGRIDVEVIQDNIVCSYCKTHEDIKVMWNVKTILMDGQNQIACKLNSQVADKLIGIPPSQGVKMCVQNPQKLKDCLTKKLNFLKGVFKMSIKPNSKKPQQPFYNIIDYYVDGYKIYLQRAVKQLKKAEQVYLHYCGIQIQEITTTKSAMIPQSPVKPKLIPKFFKSWRCFDRMNNNQYETMRDNDDDIM